MTKPNPRPLGAPAGVLTTEHAGQWALKARGGGAKQGTGRWGETEGSPSRSVVAAEGLPALSPRSAPSNMASRPAALCPSRAGGTGGSERAPRPSPLQSPRARVESDVITLLRGRDFRPTPRTPGRTPFRGEGTAGGGRQVSVGCLRWS